MEDSNNNNKIVRVEASIDDGASWFELFSYYEKEGKKSCMIYELLPVTDTRAIYFETGLPPQLPVITDKDTKTGTLVVAFEGDIIPREYSGSDDDDYYYPTLDDYTDEELLKELLKRKTEAE